MCQNHRIFVYFTKTAAATWSINKIIPISIASLFSFFKVLLNTKNEMLKNKARVQRISKYSQPPIQIFLLHFSDIYLLPYFAHK